MSAFLLSKILFGGSVRLFFCILVLLAQNTFAKEVWVDLNKSDAQKLCAIMPKVTHTKIYDIYTTVFKKQFLTEGRNFAVTCVDVFNSKFNHHAYAATAFFNDELTSPKTKLGSSPLNEKMIYAVIYNKPEAERFFSDVLAAQGSFFSDEKILLNLSNGKQLNESRLSLRCFRKKEDLKIAYCQILAVRN